MQVKNELVKKANEVVTELNHEIRATRKERNELKNAIAVIKRYLPNEVTILEANPVYTIKPRKTRTKKSATPTNNTKRGPVQGVKQSKRAYSKRPNFGLRHALEHLMKKSNNSYLFSSLMTILRKDYNMSNLDATTLERELYVHTNAGRIRRFEKKNQEVRFENKMKEDWFTTTKRTAAVRNALITRWNCTQAS